MADHHLPAGGVLDTATTTVRESRPADALAALEEEFGTAVSVAVATTRRIRLLYDVEAV